MYKNLWMLALLCSIGWAMVALGVVLKIHVIFQLLMLLVGLLFSIVCVIGLIKHLLR